MRILVRRLATIGWLATLPSGPAAAQRLQAVPGRFEIFGLDWAPRTAWRARAELVRETRWALLAQGDITALNRLAAPGQPQAQTATAVTGTFHVPVIPIAFSDIDPFAPRADFEDVLFATSPPLSRPYTLKTYYEQISNGMIQMFGRVFDAVRTDTTAEYYQQNCNGIGVRNTCTVEPRLRFGRLLIAVLDSISNRPGSDTVWARFDNDGPDGVPNSGDDDGDVDFVTFLQPAKDGACTAPGIWAHRFVVSGWNGGSKYVTKTPRRNAQGQPIPGQFIRVDNYTIQSQVGGANGCTDGLMMPIGTVAHETGHAFGLPDLYDTQVNTSGTEGIGEWGLMGSGNYSRAYSPTGFEAWSLNELGWVTIDTLGTTRVITTGPRQLTDTVFLARTRAPNELVLIENRQRVESDTAMLNPSVQSPANCKSNCRKAPGLLIWHIDLGRIEAGRNSNTINTGSTQGVALLQADGLNTLRTRGGNRGDEGDAYPGSTNNTRFTLTSNPSARTNTGLYDGFIIDQIEHLAGGVMRFRYLEREPTLVTAGLFGPSIRVNGQTTFRFEDVIPQGDQLTIDVDSVQTVSLGRTKATFLAWSIGGPRMQTVTSGATPDTITATFSAEHRVKVVTLGGGQGTVTANQPGNLGTGLFLAAGTPITLTAVPGAGSVFAGWRGDTTTTAAAVTLPMGHPYDLEASFLAEVAVDVAAATQDILGVPSLSTEQEQFLDQLGNRNGLYDVGDFLALLRRNGQVVSPDLRRALAEQGKAGSKKGA